MKLFDSHAHYCDERYRENIEQIINEIKELGNISIINAATSVESSKIVIEQAMRYDFMYATVGIHPEEIMGNIDLKEIKKLAKNNKVVAIGEIGLDYHYDTDKEKQKALFKSQIELANDIGLPIVIHNRESSKDLLDILKNEINANKRGVFHCCEMNFELIKEALKLDYYISFAGPVTFKNAKKAKDIIEYVPIEKMLIETDSPYLAPDPLRGTINTSKNIKIIAQKVAEFKEIAIEEVAEITYNNTKKVFNIL